MGAVQKNTLQTLLDKLKRDPNEYYFTSKTETNPLFVNGNVGKELQRSHKIALDFLYSCYTKKYQGAVLNQDKGLNWHLQVSAFLNALYNLSTIKKSKQTIIICDVSEIVTWHYFLTQAQFTILVLDEKNAEELNQTNPDAIIAPTQHLNLLNGFKNELAFLVVDEIDLVINKRILRQLKAHFKIGLTYKNFLINRDAKLQWTIINWTNSGCVGKKSDFDEKLTTMVEELTEFFYEYWHRLTFKIVEDDEVYKDYTEELLEWKENNLSYYFETVNLLNEVKNSKSVNKRKPKKEVAKKSKSCTNSSKSVKSRKRSTKSVKEDSNTNITHNISVNLNNVKIELQSSDDEEELFRNVKNEDDEVIPSKKRRSSSKIDKTNINPLEIKTMLDKNIKIVPQSKPDMPKKAQLMNEFKDLNSDSESEFKDLNSDTESNDLDKSKFLEDLFNDDTTHINSSNKNSNDGDEGDIEKKKQFLKELLDSPQMSPKAASEVPKEEFNIFKIIMERCENDDDNNDKKEEFVQDLFDDNSESVAAPKEKTPDLDELKKFYNNLVQ